MSKQDRQGARTPANLEQKYNFGNVFSKLDAADKQQSLTMRQFAELITETIATIQKDIKGLNTSVQTLTKKDTEIEKTMKESDNSLQDKISVYWKTIYPVGSIYVSVSDTSPAKLFGGTWKRIEDRFLLASGSSYTAGATGGEATHTLTVGEMPKHDHKLFGHAFNWGSSKGDVYIPDANAVGGQGTQNELYTDQSDWNITDFNGSGKPHNNMPPYLAVYVWKRTA